MTKSDLRTGMIATTRRRGQYVVILGLYDFTDLMINRETGCYIRLDYINEDLTCKFGEEFDITKVEAHSMAYRCWPKYNDKPDKLLWKRQTPKKMTVAEIEEILGYKIEIIAEKEN